MTETDTWLTLGEAAARTGWRPERIRSLARRGTMPRRRGNGRDWLYQVTPELVATRAEERAGTTADPRAGTDEAAQWQAVATELQEEIAELRIGLARAEERAAAGERVAAAEIAAKNAVLTELRAQIEREIARGDEMAAELAEARKPFWRRWIGS
jgi:hypothetical protein